MKTPKLIEVRLTGEQILPGSIRSKELAEIIDSIEEAIASVAARETPELSKDEIIVGLVSIDAGSMRLGFTTPTPQEVEPAFIALTESVRTSDYDNLPGSSIRALRALASIARRRNSEFEFLSVNGEVESRATITPTTVIELRPPMRGTTVLYGQVIRIGGRDPRLMFETVAGEVVYCDVPRALARELGQKLYSEVGLRGEAEWETDDMTLEAFRAVEIVEYERGSLKETMRELSEKVGQYFAEIGDVEAFIAEIRGGMETSE